MLVVYEDDGDFLAVAVCRGVGGVAPGFDEGFDAGGVSGDCCVGSWCCDGERRFKVYHYFSSFVFSITPPFLYFHFHICQVRMSNDSEFPTHLPKKRVKVGTPNAPAKGCALCTPAL